MKMLIVFLSLTCSLLAANAQDSAFVLDFYEDYPSALTQAKKADKMLMLVIIQEPCPYCDAMVEKTLPDPKVTQAIKGFISVIVDKHTSLPSAFMTTATPMTFFIDPITEEGVWESMGYTSVEEFLDDIKEAKNIHATR